MEKEFLNFIDEEKYKIMSIFKDFEVECHDDIIYAKSCFPRNEYIYQLTKFKKSEKMVEKEMDLDSSPYTAEHARKTANSMDIEKHSKILVDVLSNIKKKAQIGEFSSTVFNLPDPVRDELKKRGFKVKFFQGDRQDPRDSDYYDITW